MSSDPLGHAVREFAERVHGWVLLWPEVGPADIDRIKGELLVEARHIAASLMLADSQLDVDELLAFRVAFGATDPQVQRARFDELRDGEILRRDAGFVDEPSALFLALCRQDRERGSAGAWTYYEAALGVAHAACAFGSVSEAESAAIDRYRETLLAALRGGAARPRPGSSTGSLDWDDPNAAGGLVGEAPAAAPAIDDLLDEMDALVGLGPVKVLVHRIVNLTRVERMRAQHGLPVAVRSRHLVFVGNPGTGKTTVARLLSRVYHALGTLAKGHLVETERAGLISGFVGQTAGQVTQVARSAFGGTLFIDEAYSLHSGGDQDYGPEAIATLLKLMEDHRDELIVVIAGYPSPMQELLDSNPGLRSRFPTTVNFADYSNDELVEIFEQLGDSQGYHATAEALDAARAHFAGVARDESFGNGRLARNVFEAAIAQHADRIVALSAPTTEQLQTLLPDDVPAPPPA